MPSKLNTDILEILDQHAGGVHPGFRPVHARGVMCSGTFTPSPEAGKLTRAPHANRPSTPLSVRFSLTSGVPTAAENDPEVTSPQGIAVRFHLGDHVHTDIVGHSHNGFPVRNGEEFLDFFPGRGRQWSRRAQPAADCGVLGFPPGGQGFRRGPQAHSDQLCATGVLCRHGVQVHERRRPEPIRPVPLPP